MSKYGNRTAVVGGMAFDSRLEARRYRELVLMQNAGIIRDLRTQVRFELQPSFKKGGKTIRAITYKADFVYTVCGTGETVVEDTKGFRTEVYKIKKKIFEYRFPDLTIKEVKK